MRIAALATLLRIDPMEALKSDRSVKALGAEARKRERASEKSERDLRKLLKSFDLDLEAGSWGMAQTHISAGLATEVPPRPPEFVFLPPAGSGYTPFPFKKEFFVWRAIAYSVLELDVFTSYDTYASLADVRINGVSIGTIPPRSYAQTGGELAPLSILFSNAGLLKAQVGLSITGLNQLEIIPPRTIYDWLVVGNWRFHYYQLLQP
jgi:hypothetical protein